MAVRWTVAANPSAASAVEPITAVAVGLTVGRDFFSQHAHKGRTYFRVVARKTGAGAAAAGDAIAAWGPR